MQFQDEEQYFERFKDKKGAMKLGFGSTYSQSARYGVLTSQLDLKGKRCALLGCGEGAGIPFLQARGCEDIYGFDIIESHVEAAKEKFPDLAERLFRIRETGDMFDMINGVDWVVSSGTWNVKTPQKYGKIEQLLEHHKKIAVGIATNFTTEVPEQDDAHDFCPIAILRMFMEKFKWWKVEHTYFKHDFSIWGMNPK
jgi:SAM-dependent methyltransferase